jgi:mono/diheme cytochrome c family protein
MRFRATHVLAISAALLSFALIKAPSSAAQKYVPTYYTDIQPILEKHCVGCHVAGGIAPFVLTSGKDAVQHAADIARVVQNGSMPPWMPAKDSPPFLNDPRLKPASKQMLIDWSKANAPLGKALPGQKP